MTSYGVLITVKSIEGLCPIYEVGDKIVLEGYYIVSSLAAVVCVHALNGIMSLLLAFSHGVFARELGIGVMDDEGYVQCPDPGPPYTESGTLTFHLKCLEAVG